MKKLTILFLALLIPVLAFAFTYTWVIDQMEYATDAAAQAAYVTDGSYDSYTKTASHFDGADAAAAYTDPIAGAYTFVGNAQLDTAQKKFGTASLLLDGTGDYVSLPDSADWTFGSGNFTIDVWIRGASVDDSQLICGQSDAVATANTRQSQITVNADNTVIGSVWSNTATRMNSTGMTKTLSINTWYHIAMVRNGNTITVYIDGTADSTINVTGITLQDSSTIFSVGAIGLYTTDRWNGWIDEFRISKGIARWESAFTPDTVPYPPYLQSYSEDTIIQQGTYSLKGIAAITDSLNDTLTRTIGDNLDLSNCDSIEFDIYALRTGSNIKIGLHDSGGTTSEHTANVATSNTNQTESWDISGVADANKDDIDSIVITISNADAANTFYLDDMKWGIDAAGGGNWTWVQ